MPKEQMPNLGDFPKDMTIEEWRELKQDSDFDESEEWLNQIFQNSERPEYIDNKEGEETEEKKEQTSEKTETVKRENPVEKHWNEGVKKIKDKYLGVEIPEEIKEEAEDSLDKEEERLKIEFVKKWLADNKEDIEKKHPATKGMNEEKLVIFALTELSPEENPLNQLAENEEFERKYAPYAERASYLYIVREGIKKDPMDMESQFLALNYFYEKAKKASTNFHEKEKNPDRFSKEEIEAAKEEWLKQSKIVKDLTERFTGKDPRKQAEEKADEARPKGEKEAFINARLNRFGEIQVKKYDQVLTNLNEEELKYFKAGALETKIGDLSQEQILTIVGTYGTDALRKIRYEPWKPAHLFKTRNILIGNEIINEDDFDSFISQKKRELDEKIMADLKDAAEFQWKRKNRQEVEKRFDEIIKDVASSKGAEKIIRERYVSVKEKLYEQWEAQQAVAEKPATEEKPEKETPKEKEDADTVLNILSSKEPEEISAYLKDHGDEFCSVLENAGMSINKDYLKKFVENPKNRKSLSLFLKRFLDFISTSA